MSERQDNHSRHCTRNTSRSAAEQSDIGRQMRSEIQEQSFFVPGCPPNEIPFAKAFAGDTGQTARRPARAEKD
jgi:hypothetical protein